MQKIVLAILAACCLLTVVSSRGAAQVYNPTYTADPYAYAQTYDPYFELHQIHYQLYLRQYGYYPYPYGFVGSAPVVLAAPPAVVAAPARQPLRVAPSSVRKR